MKCLAAFLFSASLLVLPVAAQRGGSHSGGGHASGGGGHSSGSIGGHGGYSYRGSYGGGYNRGRSAVIVPYIYPAFGYGYGGPGYGYGFGDPGYSYAPPPPPDAVDYGQPAPPPDPNQYPPEQIPQPDNSALQIYQSQGPTPEEQAMNEGRYYLIAYKDHSVYTALAYWMENGALNYVTPQSAHNQVSLDLVDLDLTKQLNARHGLAFNIVTR